ncbi:hypothetical protein [Peribacillus frigoritolerans]|uniref:hypothetical protein n=1 Tax=Peribacillus frigoritolerans TaxID=450367 RepID=UPI00207A6FCA|nr:hypothetical protein [Peribacillus frigoritolerans]USK66315.1 hypothetical protein LIT26_06705 [Peribacillus frigoritolerans]
MDMAEKENAFLEELKKLMLKHGVSSIMTGEEGAIYCDSDYFSADEALITFDNT